MMASQAVRQAPDDPGKQNKYVALATPAMALDCMVEVLIS
jgi:hypothetical protein